METSNITDQDEPNEYGLDVSCNLGSLDIHKATKSTSFEELVDTAMRLLTNVSLMTNIKNVPSVAKANKLMHSVGLGVMNLHGHLVSEGIYYGSEASIEFIDYFMEAVNYYSLKTSMDIAKERQETFYGFEKSDYADGSYFEAYINKEDIEPSKVVKKALGNVSIITSVMWKKLKEDVQKHGIYSAYRLATAPTGSISYIRSCTASIPPYRTRRNPAIMPIAVQFTRCHFYRMKINICMWKLMMSIRISSLIYMRRLKSTLTKEFL